MTYTRIPFFFAFLFSIIQLSSIAQNSIELPADKQNKYIHSEGMTVGSRFFVADAGPDYYRKPIVNGSFEYYLFNLPLKPATYKTHEYTGEEKKFDIQIGVIDTKIGTNDIVHCGEALMKLRAEYLYDSRLYGRIHFLFTNGFNFTYAKWAAGFRLNNTYNGWIQTESLDYSKKVFHEYLNALYAHANANSLTKEMTPIELKDVKPGDVFIQSGNPGHAVIILDVLHNDVTNTVKLMLAQGFIPAQEIEILKNFEDQGSPWYTLSINDTPETMILTPQWTFYVKDLKRFR